MGGAKDAAKHPAVPRTVMNDAAQNVNSAPRVEKFCVKGIYSGTRLAGPSPGLSLPG